LFFDANVLRSYATASPLSHSMTRGRCVGGWASGNRTGVLPLEYDKKPALEAAGRWQTLPGAPRAAISSLVKEGTNKIGTPKQADGRCAA
jgi:hypothetical protein